MDQGAGCCKTGTPMPGERHDFLKAVWLAFFISLCFLPVSCLAGGSSAAQNIQSRAPVPSTPVPSTPMPSTPMPVAPPGAFPGGPGKIENKKPVDLGRITGRLLSLHGDKPLSGGMAYFFNAAGPPPSRDRYWRVPDKTAPIDADGKFSVELPVGRYFMGAVKRVSGKKDMGPPHDGDLFYGAQERNGRPREFQIKKDGVLDIGTIAQAVPFKRKTKGVKDITAIEGRICGQDGKPVKGAIVFAYTVSSMTGRPVFVSDKTGPDGKYILRVYEGGVYYLRARNQYGGGKPKGGSLIGSYGYSDLNAMKKKGIGIAVKTGQVVSPRDIKVLKVPERRQVNGALPGQNTTPAPGSNPAAPTNSAIINGAAR